MPHGPLLKVDDESAKLAILPFQPLVSRHDTHKIGVADTLLRHPGKRMGAITSLTAARHRRVAPIGTGT